MATVSGLIWDSAGTPQMDGVISGACQACGQYGIGLSSTKFIKDTFTDHDKLHSGQIICHACQFCFADQNAVLTLMTYKEKTQRMRNYSHFVLDGKWFPLSKGDKGRMMELLNQRPEAVVIADSGQKHILFRAKVGWWQIEEKSILPFPHELRMITDVIQPLYQSGISKAEIKSGRYSPNRISNFGLEAWVKAEGKILGWRGSIKLELSLFLLQKEENDESRNN
jgi:hypothetical protein